MRIFGICQFSVSRFKELDLLSGKMVLYVLLALKLAEICLRKENRIISGISVFRESRALRLRFSSFEFPALSFGFVVTCSSSAWKNESSCPKVSRFSPAVQGLNDLCIQGLALRYLTL